MHLRGGRHIVSLIIAPKFNLHRCLWHTFLCTSHQTHSSLILAANQSLLSNRVPWTPLPTPPLSSAVVTAASRLLALSLSSNWLSWSPSSLLPSIVAGPTILPLRALSRDLGCLEGTIEGGTGLEVVPGLDLAASFVGEIYKVSRKWNSKDVLAHA